MTGDQKQLRDALNYAIQIIESYQLDIRNWDAESNTPLPMSTTDGVTVNYTTLEDKGFCQGSIYKAAISDIKRRAGIE